VSISQKEREAFLENKVVNYYRACIIELEEKGRVLEVEVQILKDMNLKYSQELYGFKERVRVLESRESDLINAAHIANERFEEAQRNMLQAQAIEKQRLEDQYSKEKQLMEDELKVNEVLIK
jgi:hypothetical protein